MVVRGCLWLSMLSYGYLRSLMVVDKYLRIFMVAYGCLWFSVDVFWMFVGFYGCFVDFRTK